MFIITSNKHLKFYIKLLIYQRKLPKFIQLQMILTIYIYALYDEYFIKESSNVTFFKHNLVTHVLHKRTIPNKTRRQQIVWSKSDYELSLLCHCDLDSDLSASKKYTRIRLYRTSSSLPLPPFLNPSINESEASVFRAKAETVSNAHLVPPRLTNVWKYKAREPPAICQKVKIYEGSRIVPRSPAGSLLSAHA